MTLSTTLTTIESLVKHWVTFVKGHEKLVMILVFAFLSYHFAMKGFTAWENHDKRVSAIAQQKVDTDTANNKALAEELAQLRVEIAAKNAQLEAKIAVNKQKVIVQQKIDANLPLPDLSKRWETLLVLSEGSITPKPDGTITVTTDAAHATVNELEKVPQLTEQVIDTQAELQGCNTLSAKKDDAITGLKGQLADEQTARKDDQKLAKVQQRKAWLRGFKWGAVAGFIGGVFIGHGI